MEETRPILFLMRVILEVPAREGMHEAMMQATHQLQHAIKSALGDLPNHLGYQGTRFIYLSEDAPNSGRCAVCGLWVSDTSDPNHVMGVGLRYGKVVDGQLFCEDHIPTLP